MIRAGVQAFVMSVLLLAGCDGQGQDVSQPAAPVSVEAAPVTEAESGATVIVMLGDSLTAGYGLPDEASLPSVVRRELTSRGYDVDVINAGVSGDTSSAARARYNWSVASVEPDILVVALGANDFLSGVPVNVPRENLAAIIEQAQNDGISVVLAGLNPRSEGGNGSREASYAAIYPELSETYSVPLYPDLMAGVWDRPELLLPDGLHPTPAGVEIMASGLAPVIEPLLTAAN